MKKTFLQAIAALCVAFASKHAVLANPNSYPALQIAGTGLLERNGSPVSSVSAANGLFLENGTFSVVSSGGEFSLFTPGESVNVQSNILPGFQPVWSFSEGPQPDFFNVGGLAINLVDSIGGDDYADFEFSMNGQAPIGFSMDFSFSDVTPGDIYSSVRVDFATDILVTGGGGSSVPEGGRTAWLLGLGVTALLILAPRQNGFLVGRLNS